MTGSSKGKGNCSSNEVGNKLRVPKPEPFDFELPPDSVYRRPLEENVTSSSGSNRRSSFIEMGFLPSLVDMVINEKGEEDDDLLLETLLQYSVTQKAGSRDSFFQYESVRRAPKTSPLIQPKEELDDAFDEVSIDKRASLLGMNFSAEEVDFAFEKLGEEASVDEMVDFITAAQMAENFEKQEDFLSGDEEDKEQDTSDELLFATMTQTLQLLQMGFSENEASLAIENLGPEAPISELADSIVSGHITSKSYRSKKYKSAALARKDTHVAEDSKSFGRGREDSLKHNSFDQVNIKTENTSSVAISQARVANVGESSKGKKRKEKNLINCPNAQFKHVEENNNGKKPKQESIDGTSFCLDPSWLEEKVDPQLTIFQLSKPFKSISGKSVNEIAAKPPYFFYGDVNASHGRWPKISQFLYEIVPEFVNTESFSALSRIEGYIHNLPNENRFHILLKSPLTIADILPHTKKWWPSWDTRKFVNCICSETNELSQLCDRLGKMLTTSEGLPLSESQKCILNHCRRFSLIWIDKNKLGPLLPAHYEHLLGYPLNHTQSNLSSIERFQSLKHCFQTDTLGYHLSVLKLIFPEGITILSVFSGIGGAEIALHRLGIRLKGVISVEASETNRKILKNWWHSSGQTGGLVQIEDIQKLGSKKLESLIQKFGGIDFVIGQNPGTFSKGSSNTVSDYGNRASFDFPLFIEFVRVLKLVRSMMERR